MKVTNQIEPENHRRRPIFEALIGGATFFALSYLSRFLPSALNLMVIFGIALPLGWGKLTGKWEEMGFSKERLGSSLLWGLGAGTIATFIGLAVAKERMSLTHPELELLIGVPLWILVASPFQEFFFRGWLQPRFQTEFGKWTGLILATLIFTLWHYVWPLASHTSIPLTNLTGLIATLGAGLIYGYSFQKTGNIVAPWLGHAISGIMFMLLGIGSFFGANP